MTERKFPMKPFRIALTILCLLPSVSTCLGQGKWYEMSDEKPKKSNKSGTAGPDWHSPERACFFLSDLGIQTQGYKNYGISYGCSSPYKEIGSAFPLPNNIAYYASGDQLSANQLKLVLNVNHRGDAETANRELLKLSEALANRAIKVK